MKKDVIILFIKKIQNHDLFYSLMIGILIRYSIALYTIQPNDIIVWFKESLNVIYGLGIYERPYFAYPPIWGYILGVFLKFSSLIFNPREYGYYIKEFHQLDYVTGMVSGFVTTPLFNFLYKTPLIITDIIIGYLIYKVILELKNDKRFAIYAFNLWFFNPLVILVSSYIGKFDNILTLFILLIAIFVYKRNWFFTGISLGLGIFTKIYPIIFLPIILILILVEKITDRYQFKKIILNLLYLFFGIFLTSSIIILPLLFNDEYGRLFSPFTRIETGVGVGGMSIWSVRYLTGHEWIYDWAHTHTKFVISTLFKIQFSLILFITVLFIFKYIKSKEKLITYYIFTLIILISYLTNYTLNPPYLLWIFPLLIILGTYTGFGYNSYKKIMLIIFIYGVISTSAFLLAPLLKNNAPFIIYILEIILILSLLIRIGNIYLNSLLILTISGITFYYAIKGIWSDLAPFAIFTNILDLKNIDEYTIRYISIKGLFNNTVSSDIYLLTGLLVNYCFILVFVSIIKYLWIRDHILINNLKKIMGKVSRK